uniref:RING-type domain-containing protein n=1 Tax=Arcella intermedia TaxID=1963864 RepID=A0A6B2L5U9_9EUKA
MKDIKCVICSNILREPTQCLAGDLFCFSCISSHLSTSNTCPACSTKLNKNLLSRSLFTERHIRRLNVYCCHHFYYDQFCWKVDEQGCDFSAKLEDIQNHEKECGFKWVACPFGISCDLVRKKDLDEHKKNCNYRPIPCPYCRVEFEAISLVAHEMGCDAVPIACKLCSKFVPKKSLTLHLDKTCPESLTYCPFFCKEKIYRKNMKQHFEEKILEHFEEMNQRQEMERKKLENEFGRELQKKEVELLQLRKGIKKGKKEKKFVWVIDNWNSIENYEESNVFSFGGCKWCLGLYKNGDDEDSRGFISLYLLLEKGPDKGKVVELSGSIKLINFNNLLNNIKKEFETTFPQKASLGWGERRFIPQAQLNEDNGFVFKDRVKVELKLYIKSIIYWV